MILAIAAAQQRYEELLGRMLTPEEGEAFRTGIRAALKNPAATMEQLVRMLTPEEGAQGAEIIVPGFTVHNGKTVFGPEDLAPSKPAQPMVPGYDPVELRPVRRMSFAERSHVEIGIKGGQLRSGAEIEASADGTVRAFAVLGILALIIAAASAWA